MICTGQALPLSHFGPWQARRLARYAMTCPYHATIERCEHIRTSSATERFEAGPDLMVATDDSGLL
jgi:hypothetical protein